MREHLASLVPLLRDSGQDWMANAVEDALNGSEAQFQSFLVSNELWGGSGSIADSAAAAGRSELRRKIERLLIQLGEEQLRAGRVNVRTEMWVGAFRHWAASGL